MLFECHICDRKFKKLSDRDRHLNVHNYKIEHTIFSCELCQYETSKEVHLDIHYVKVKVILRPRSTNRLFLFIRVLF